MTRLPEGTDIREVPVGVLAYIGDAVYELRARLRAAGDMKKPSGAMHALAVKLVRAGAQARAARLIQPMLTDEERNIYLRARNHAVTSSPRNADPMEYRMATGFEAVLGFLYLHHRDQRLDEIIQTAFTACETDAVQMTGETLNGETDRQET